MQPRVLGVIVVIPFAIPQRDASISISRVCRVKIVLGNTTYRSFLQIDTSTKVLRLLIESGVCFVVNVQKTRLNYFSTFEVE